MARILGTTPDVIKRVLKSGESAGKDGLPTEYRRSGRPRKDVVLTPDQLDWITSGLTLREQMGLSISARCKQFNELFNGSLKPYQYRRIYR